LPKRRRGGRSHWRLWLTLAVMTACVAGAAVAVWKYNLRVLQAPMDHVLADHAENGRISVRAHYRQYVHNDVLVLDLRGLSGEPTRMDIFSAMLDYAAALKQTRFREIIFASNGREKFAMDGAYFQQLGCDYKASDPLAALYVVWEFPGHIFDMQGRRPYFAPQDPDFAHRVDHFNRFMTDWYEKDVTVVEKK